MTKTPQGLNECAATVVLKKRGRKSKKELELTKIQDNITNN